MSVSVPSVLRVALLTTASALIGAAALVTAYTLSPGFTLEMDRSLPTIVTGFYESERAGQETFAWSQRQATMRLADLDRRGQWSCTVRLRGGRQDESLLPEVVFAVDGIVTTRHQTTNDFSDVIVPVAPRDGTGATITLTTDTFVPDGGDSRQLGVFVDRWRCAPEAGFAPWPPNPAIRSAAIGAATFGGVLALMGAPVLVTAGGVAILAGLQAVPLVRDLGPFSTFALPVGGLASALAALMWVGLRIARAFRGRPVSVAGQVAVVVTVAILYLKLLALLHPSKLLIDAVFNAHRLQWVLEGRYFFTQPMPSGVRFPYAIGLYVFAMPWTVFTSDFVTLLRLIITGAEAASGLLLYHVIVRYWGDRTVAATATCLYGLVPRTFEIVGNANMPNSFGQSVALTVLVAATLWPLSGRRWRRWAALSLLIASALLCHISTLTTLGTILATLTAAYWWVSRPPLRREAVALATATLTAVLLATIVYYGHFGDAYRSALRVRAAPTEASEGPGAASTPLTTKVTDAARASVDAVGWPIVLLAVPGVVAWRRRGWRDRLSMAVAALAITFVGMTLSVVVAPVDQAFHRYAVEFISRVTLATYPAMVIWAALGSVWAWRTGGWVRVGGAAVIIAALAVAGDAWIGWIR